MDYTLILNRRYQGAQWNLNGEDYSGLEWLADTKKPTQKELEAQWDSVLTEVEAEQIQRTARRAEILERLGLTEDEAKLLFS